MSGPGSATAGTVPAAPTAGRDLTHVPALDGLRGIAVIGVVVFHFSLAYLPRADGLAHLPSGFIGVDLFFVLSGFLITSILLGEYHRDRRISLSRFYARRAVRLLPALVVLVGGVVAVAAVDPRVGLRSTVTTAAQALGYVANLAGTFGWDQVRDLEHAWSLSVEEQFYAVWPLVLLLVVRRSRRVVVTVLLALVVMALALRLSWYGDGSLIGAARTETRADSLVIGALVACAFRWRTIPTAWAQRIGVVGLLAFGALLFGTQDYGWYARWGYTLVAVVAGMAVLGAADPGPRLDSALSWAPLRAVGRVSYGIYLWHVPVMYTVARHGDGVPDLVQLGVATAVTAGLVIASWHWVERPWLRRKPGPAPTGPAAGSRTGAAGAVPAGSPPLAVEPAAGPATRRPPAR